MILAKIWTGARVLMRKLVFISVQAGFLAEQAFIRPANDGQQWDSEPTDRQRPADDRETELEEGVLTQ
jgi:hypothetical protein